MAARTKVTENISGHFHSSPSEGLMLLRYRVQLGSSSSSKYKNPAKIFAKAHKFSNQVGFPGKGGFVSLDLT